MSVEVGTVFGAAKREQRVTGSPCTAPTSAGRRASRPAPTARRSTIPSTTPPTVARWVDATVTGAFHGAALTARAFGDYTGYRGAYRYLDGLVDDFDTADGAWLGAEGTASRRLGSRHQLSTGIEYRRNAPAGPEQRQRRSLRQQRRCALPVQPVRDLRAGRNPAPPPADRDRRRPLRLVEPDRRDRHAARRPRLPHRRRHGHQGALRRGLPGPDRLRDLLLPGSARPDAASRAAADVGGRLRAVRRRHPAAHRHRLRDHAPNLISQVELDRSSSRTASRRGRAASRSRASGAGRAACWPAPASSCRRPAIRRRRRAVELAATAGAGARGRAGRGRASSRSRPSRSTSGPGSRRWARRIARRLADQRQRHLRAGRGVRCRFGVHVSEPVRSAAYGHPVGLEFRQDLMPQDGRSRLGARDAAF